MQIFKFTFEGGMVVFTVAKTLPAAYFFLECEVHRIGSVTNVEVIQDNENQKVYVVPD